jgi:hypothetical protein
LTKSQKQCNKKIIFSINDAGKIRYPHANYKKHLDTELISLTKLLFKKFSLKWIIGMNVKCTTIKPLENNMGAKSRLA